MRPLEDIPTGEIAQRIAERVTPDLRAVQSFVAFSGQVAQALASLDPEVVKDVGGAANSAAELGLRAARVTGQRLSGEARALAGAGAHARVAGQLGFDLVRARVAVTQAEEAVRYFRSPAAESALIFMRPELQKLEAAFAAERAVQGQYREIAVSLRSKVGSFGVLAHSAESAASRSSLGRGLLAGGKVLASQKFGSGIVALGVGIAAIKGYSEAPTESRAWKAGYSATAGMTAAGSDLAMTQAVLRGGNPLILFYDPAVKYGAKALGFEDAGDKLTVGKFFEDCSKSIVSLTQAMRTGDTAPTSAVHKRNMEGAGSTVIQGYAMLGDALSRSSLVDTAMTKVADWYHNVPGEFQTSPGWWSAFKSDAETVADVGKGAWITLKEAVGLRD